MYFCECIGNIDIDLIILLFMNSKYVSGISGVLVIFNVSLMKVFVNVW